MLGLLERLRFVRAIALSRNLGDNIHPGRLAKFAREGAVAPVNLLSDFGKRRRIASLAPGPVRHPPMGLLAGSRASRGVKSS